MPEIDTAAVRAAIERVLGDDEVMELTRTFRGHGPGGRITIELWHHPDIGFMVTASDELGRKITGNNPVDDAVHAVQLAHWGAVTREEG